MGVKRFDQIIVADLEATCWEPKEAQGSQPSEIIEVGVCRLSTDNWSITDKKSLIVRPKFSEITKFCTELTGLTWKKVKNGMPLEGACNHLFKKFGTKHRTWASWGDYDRIHFLRECKEKGVKYPFGPSHINVCNLYCLTTGKTKYISVEHALEEIGLEFEGRPHCGADDAFNTAKILSYLLENRKNNQ